MMLTHHSKELYGKRWALRLIASHHVLAQAPHIVTLDCHAFFSAFIYMLPKEGDLPFSPSHNPWVSIYPVNRSSKSFSGNFHSSSHRAVPPLACPSLKRMSSQCLHVYHHIALHTSSILQISGRRSPTLHGPIFFIATNLSLTSLAHPSSAAMFAH